MRKSTIQTTPPPSDQAEISIFGPGIGECIALHFGDGEWVIIDSCICPETKRPIALEYLESIGVNPKEQVKALIITHWDNDHIRGSFDIVKSCPNAKLCFSQALYGEEAFSLARAQGKNSLAKLDEEVEDFYNIVKHKTEERIDHTIAGTKAKNLFFTRAKYSARLIALSPSDEAVNQSIANIVNLTPKPGERRKRTKVKASRNLNAIALYFEFSGHSVLLGSDLEEPENKTDLTGWSAILNSGILTDLEIPKSTVFKVPHHGSSNGHHNHVVSQLLAPKPLSITTPYTASGLPLNSDINRIKDYSREFWVATEKGGKIKRSRQVTELLKAQAKDWFTINQKMGHIQLRFSKDQKIKVKTNQLPICYRK